MSVERAIAKIAEMKAGLEAEISARQARIEALDEILAALDGQEGQKPAESPAPQRPYRRRRRYDASRNYGWSDEMDAKLTELWSTPLPVSAIAERFGKNPVTVSAHAKAIGLPNRRQVGSRHRESRRREPGEPFRRFTEHGEPDPQSVMSLADNHPAVAEGRCLFPNTVAEPLAQTNVLVSGGNSRKLGDRVTKGPWRGLPIFSLTLEERATCPRTCHHWTSCYGNGMPLARRHRHGPDLVAAIDRDLDRLLAAHTGGIVVRLHQLGDFYDNNYVCAWWSWLKKHEGLRVFGYTAHPKDSKIGKAVDELNRQFPERCAVRFSAAEPQAMGATTIWRKARGRVTEGIVCPAQTGGTACCGTCGLCWNPDFRDKTIVFMAHGRKLGPRQATTEARRTKAPAPKRTPEPDTVPANGKEVRETGGYFNKPVQRRCPACQGIFETKLLRETICPDCRGSSAHRPSSGAEASP